MPQSTESLRDFRPTKEWFVGIDSDGCVFDSMEIKHKECFTPMFIKHFGLQAVSKYARETWDFVNLYSKSRGVNRFPALSKALKLLAERPQVRARGVQVPSTAALDEWLTHETRLSNAALQQAIDSGRPALAPVLAWSQAVNAMIEDLVYGVPPFPYMRQCLERLTAVADVMVISQTPTAALEREWAEHDLAGHVALIAGQELGTKTEHLRLTSAGKYAPRHVLMIGDAPGDHSAAKANQALFFPVVPGQEEASWQQLFEEGIDRFLTDRLAGEYEAGLLRTFEASLPERPPWR